MGTSDELCKKVSEISPNVICSFSMGKDSLAALIQMRRHFERVELVFMYMIPDLEFQNESLAYYERVLGQKIKRMPNPSLHRQINNLMYQPPTRVDVIESLDIYEGNYDEIFAAAKYDYKLPEETFVGVGVRMADSLARRAAVKQTGGINLRRKIFWPVFDWNMERTLNEIRGQGWKLPIDYKIWGRTFDGLDYRFLSGVKNNFPNDYEKIIEWFPLANLELKRYETFA